VETEAAELKKVSYMAVACSSYAYIQPTPPEPYSKAPYKIKIPRRLKEPLQSPEAPHWRQTLTVKTTQHKKVKTHRFVKSSDVNGPVLFWISSVFQYLNLKPVQSFNWSNLDRF